MLSISFDFSLYPNIKLNESNKHDRLKHHPPKFQPHRSPLICLMYVRHHITSLVNGLICIYVMMLEVRIDRTFERTGSSFSLAIEITAFFFFFQMDDHAIPTLMMAELYRYPYKVSKSTTIHSIWPKRDDHIGPSNISLSSVCGSFPINLNDLFLPPQIQRSGRTTSPMVRTIPQFIP